MRAMRYAGRTRSLMPPKATQLLPLLFASRVRSSSSRGTLMIRRARDLNRLIGLCGAALSPPLAAPLTSDVSRSRRRWRMICQFLVRQPPPCDRRADLPEPLAIIVLSLIEPEGLFVQIPAQMRRINTDVGSLKGAFQEAPEFSMLLVWTFPRTKSIAWSIISCV